MEYIFLRGLETGVFLGLHLALRPLFAEEEYFGKNLSSATCKQVCFEILGKDVRGNYSLLELLWKLFLVAIHRMIGRVSLGVLFQIKMWL